jgi:excisionase family DNA binding protein
MTNRRPTVANGAPDAGGGDDDLTRLVRVIARQAAQEAFNLFRDALETPLARARPASDPQQAAAREVTADKAPESGERFLSIAEVAKRLGVSVKTVRRKIGSGELPAHRVGKLLRIGERSLAACVAPNRPHRK